MNERSISNPLDRPTAIFGGVAVSAIGALFYNLLPGVTGAAQEFRGLSDQQIGLIGSFYFLGFNVVTILAFYWIRKYNWRSVTLLALPLAAAALYMASLSTGFVGLLTAVFVCGGGLAAAYGIGTTVLGDSSNAARCYGIKIAAEAGLGAALFILLPGLVIVPYGFDGLLLVMAGIVLLGTLAVLALPASGVKTGYLDEGSGTTSVLDRNQRLAIWTGLIAIGLFMMGQTGIWAFVERIGSQGTLDEGIVTTVLALSLLSALAGSFTAAAIGEKLGYLRPLTIAVMMFLAAMVALFYAELGFTYGLGACLLMFSVGLGLPVSISLIARLDLDGRYVVLTVPAIGIGAMFGPGIVGYLAGSAGYVSALGFGALMISLAYLFFSKAAGKASAGRVSDDSLQHPPPV